MNCQVVGDTGSISHAAEVTGGSVCSNETKNVGGSSDGLSGWMYLNELGQMCGPYISQQLAEGLSSGFLPDELPVYPVVNGALMVAVPLKLFREYPDHVSTGFTYLNRPTSNASTGTDSHSLPMQDIYTDSSYVQPNSNHSGHGQQISYNSNTTILDSKIASSNSLEQQQPLTWENKCWQYLDGSGKPAGPYSLSELYYWHQYGYLPDSVMISHVENKSSPCALLPLINACRKDNVPSGTIPGHETSGDMQLVSDVSEEIGSQLHNCIMKASRRLVLDEIIGNVVVEFLAKKKSRKQVKTEQESNGVKRCFLKDEEDKVGAGEGNARPSLAAAAACHDVSTSEYSGDNSTQGPCSIKNTKSIGGVENFQAAKTAISHMLFDYCSQVLWNAVFYDLVGNCALSWRKSKRWSGSCTDGTTVSAQQSIPIPLISDASAQVRESDLPDDELDFPPGFQHKLNDYSFSNSFPSCSDIIENNLSSPITSVRTRSRDDKCEEAVARVQEELFLASKASMVDFMRSCVEEEVLKLSNCWKDSQMREVSPEVTEQICNVTDSGEPASSEMAQGLDSGHISLDNRPSNEMLSSHKPSLNSHKQPSDFLGSSFQILGAPCSISAPDLTADEPPPPGLTAPGDEPCPQHLQLNFLNQFRAFSRTVKSTQKASLPLYEDGSTGFLGSAFKRLGIPRCSSVDGQITDEPPPGFRSGFSNGVNSGDHKFPQLVLDMSIPKWRKFVILALLRQKLHNDVLREWTSFFRDGLHSQMKQRDLEKTFVASEKLAKVASAVEPELDVLTERSRSCYTSGPSELSVVEITYSRRKVSKKLPTKVHLEDIQSSKCKKQSITKKVACSAAPGIGEDRHAADQLCLKVEESVSRTDKAVVSMKGNLIKNGQPARSSYPRKRQRVAGESLSIAAKDYVKRGVEKVAGAGKNTNATDELSTCYEGTKKDKLAIDCSKLPTTSSDVSKLKRKFVTDESPSLQSKGAKNVKVDVKQAPCKKNGKGRTQTSMSKAMNLCPVSSGCARTSINGWEWRKWSLNARPGERARVRGIKLPTVHFGSDLNPLLSSHAKGISARTNRVKLRNLLAAAEGAEILKASQLKARKKRLRFQRSKIHDWGLIALEPIEAEDFVIEYIGELIRPRISDIRECEYEKMGIGSSYLFRLDDGYVVDATKRGGIARFINHSCEPNCYTKTVTVDGQKRIFIYAKRHIASGEEITYNYKFPLEEKKIPCNCGAKRCRGSMN